MACSPRRWSGTTTSTPLTSTAWGAPSGRSAASSPVRARRGTTSSASRPRRASPATPQPGGGSTIPRAHLAAELDGSLARLGVEAVDRVYVHRRDPELPIEEVAETLAGLKRAGKAHAVGFSEIAPASLLRAAAVPSGVAAVQSEYSLATRAPELGLVQACARLGAALVAFSPVGRGLFTDAPPGPDRIAASTFLRANPRFRAPNLAANLRADRPLPGAGRRDGRPVPRRSRSPGCSPATPAWCRSPAPTPSPICASWRRARRGT